MKETGSTGSFIRDALKKVTEARTSSETPKKAGSGSNPSALPTRVEKPKAPAVPLLDVEPSSVRSLETSSAAEAPSSPAASSELTKTQASAASRLTGPRTTRLDLSPSSTEETGDKKRLSLVREPEDGDDSSPFASALTGVVGEFIQESEDPLSVHAEPPTDEEGEIRGDSRGNTVTTYDDGTRVSRSVNDGVPRTTTTVTDEDGTVTQTTSFTEDGVTHSNTTITNPNGSVRTINDRVVDDELQRTESRTYELDGDDIIEEIPRPGLVQVDTDGAGPIERTNERVGVFDLSLDPPEYRPISEVETTTVELPNVEEDGDEFELRGPDLFHTDSLDLGRDVTINQGESGRTATLEVQTLYDENGEAQEPVEVFTFETRINGVDAQGNEVSIVEQEGNIIQRDVGITDFRVVDHRGVHRTEDVVGNSEFGDLEDYPQFADRVVGNSGEYVDVRTTQYDGQSYQVEVGNYASPGDDGETVTIHRSPEGESVSLRKVSNEGRNVDEQTVYPGTELTSISRSEFQDDGTYTTRSETINSGETIQEVVREGQVIERDDVNRDINSEARSQFLDNAEGEIVEESVTTTNFDEDGNAQTETGFNYRASESDANLQFIDGPDGELSVVQHGDEIYAVDQSGTVIETNGSGQFVVDGEVLRDEDGGAFSIPSPLSRPRSGVSALNRLFKAAEQRGIRNNPFPQSFQNKVSALGAGFAAVNIGAEILEGDIVGALEDTGSGAVSLVGGAKLLKGSTVLLRRLNVAGAVLNGGLAVRDIANGDYLDAGLKAGTAGGLVLAAIGGTVTGPLGLAILGGIGLFELGRFIFSSGGEGEDLPELVI
jgi:hypothetical protein